MAKKRKGSRKVVRRRVGKVAGSEGLQTLIGAVAGSIGSRFLAKMVQSKMNIDAKLLNAGFLVAGGLLTMKTKNPLFKGVGIGLGSAAAIGMGQSFGLLSGIGNVNTLYINRAPKVGNTNLVTAPRVGNSTPTFFPSPRVPADMNAAFAGVYGN